MYNIVQKLIFLVLQELRFWLFWKFYWDKLIKNEVH
jgi:hypothetical protein